MNQVDYTSRIQRVESLEECGQLAAEIENDDALPTSEKERQLKHLDRVRAQLEAVEAQRGPRERLRKLRIRATTFSAGLNVLTERRRELMTDVRQLERYSDELDAVGRQRLAYMQEELSRVNEEYETLSQQQRAQMQLVTRCEEHLGPESRPGEFVTRHRR